MDSVDLFFWIFVLVLVVFVVVGIYVSPYNSIVPQQNPIL